jgi:entericidin A
MRKCLSFMLVMMAFLTGCNTVEGFGKDVSKAGDKIESAAKK